MAFIFNPDVVSHMKAVIKTMPADFELYAEDHCVVIPHSEYTKFNQTYGEKSIKFETFADRPIAVVITSKVKGISEGDIIAHAEMRGHRVFLQTNKDYHIKVLHREDILLKITNNQEKNEL